MLRDPTAPARPSIKRADLEDIREVATLVSADSAEAASVGLTATRARCSAPSARGGATHVAPSVDGRSRPRSRRRSRRHIGVDARRGDQFAGNMLASPRRRLLSAGCGPAEGVDIATAYVAGTLELEHFRRYGPLADGWCRRPSVCSGTMR